MENPLYLVMVLKSHGKPIVFSDGSESHGKPIVLVMVLKSHGKPIIFSDGSEKSWKTHCI